MHFTASSAGHVVTLDRRIGRLVWERDFGSPVVAIYLMDPDGLVAAPFTSLSHETLGHFAEHFSTQKEPFKNQPPNLQL